MAAENALIALGEVEAVSEQPHDLATEPYCWEDFTADLADTNSSLYFDFADIVYAQNAEGDSIGYEDFDENSSMIGKNTITILSELRPDAKYKVVSESLRVAELRFVMSVKVDKIEYRGSGSSKRLAKGRAAREALKDLTRMQFGVSEGIDICKLKIF